MKKICLTGVCILLLIITATFTQAQSQQSHQEPEWMSQITEVQKSELSELVKEITITMLSEWGIEVSYDELPPLSITRVSLRERIWVARGMIVALRGQNGWRSFQATREKN